eukprot:scaffold31684_cov69-Phaeocystis_antarctica.AAC.2
MSDGTPGASDRTRPSRAAAPGKIRRTENKKVTEGEARGRTPLAFGWTMVSGSLAAYAEQRVRGKGLKVSVRAKIVKAENGGPVGKAHLRELLGGALGAYGRRWQRPKADVAKRTHGMPCLDAPRPFCFFLQAAVHSSSTAGPACQADPQRIAGGVAGVANEEASTRSVVRSARRTQLGGHGIPRGA